MRRRSLEALALAVAAGMLAAVLVALSARFAVALGVGALLQATLAFAYVLARRALIGRLATEPAAYGIEDVRRYGLSVANQTERDRLAQWIRTILTETAHPGTLYLADRVATYASELDVLARELLSRATFLDPPSAVACRRLLTHAIESPLYNPEIPPDDVVVVIRRIRGGFRPSSRDR